MQRRVVVCGIVVLCFAVGMAIAADVNVGSWKVNLAKSKYNLGPPPKSQTTKIEPMGDGFKVTTDVVGPDGKSTHTELVGKYDGKYYPVKGATNTTRAYKKIDDYTYEFSTKVGDKITGTTRSIIARDGKSRTNTATGTNAQGQTVTNVVVSDKQ